jgi:hypothetical protein
MGRMGRADLGLVHGCPPYVSGGVKWVPRARPISIRGGGKGVESPDLNHQAALIIAFCLGAEVGLDETLMKLMTFTCRRVCTAVAVLC